MTVYIVIIRDAGDTRATAFRTVAEARAFINDSRAHWIEDTLGDDDEHQQRTDYADVLPVDDEDEVSDGEGWSVALQLDAEGRPFPGEVA